MLKCLQILGGDILDYKYKKNQIIGKRLKVPKDILNMIYNSKLPGELYFKYNL